MLHDRRPHEREERRSTKKTINPSTSMSDQDRISPYNINTISSRQVMRIK